MMDNNHVNNSAQDPKNEITEETKSLNELQNFEDSTESEEQTKLQPISGSSNISFIINSQQLKDRRSITDILCCRNNDSKCLSGFKSYEILDKLYLTNITCVALLWLAFYSVIGSTALPGGHFFALIVLIICCIIAGKLVSLLKFPPLLGMLLMGFLLRNIPKVNVATDLDQNYSSSLRSIALVVILIRAGLGLDPHALKRLSFVCLRLSFLPCLTETIIAAISAHFLLGLPWLWGFILGFVLAAVSPAVVVPCMIAIQEKGLGCKKGIPTLVIAAASVDDVLAISGFGVVLGITFSSGSLIWTIFKGPLEVVIGLSYGLLLGVLSWYIPTKSTHNIVLYRFLMLSSGGLVAVFGSRMIDFGGAGALACLVFSFVAAFGWRKQGWTGDSNPVSDIFAKLWFFFQPILFGLIGAEITIDQLDASTVGYGLLVLLIGLSFRIAVTYLVVAGAGLNLKERIFIALAWLPKATVQAAIGPVALDYARQKSNDEMEHYGLQILTISVLVILATAPIGALAITLTAPKLLTSDKAEKKEEENVDVSNAA